MADLPATNKRVKKHTKEEINLEVKEQIQQNVDYYKNKSPEEISGRLEELDQEWDTERVLEANAASLVIAGSILGATVSRKWNILPGIVGGFLLQHALQGWCPPLSVIRRAGVRTEAEIQEEKNALKELRGDFH
ncbi:YgaP family membrane protein [Salipaludibacillus aurantiacus]|uniref:Inner membrane protein YgaP-like transmembrane domain-containing protein n=1 Tax=Salipaludibacillus aurantiacus TaxID=1601833 RepID=A0A1H9X8R4_9BACI|nr:DUF2892 domain-containing protein [Salipaludibacillus aurantiacus]SES42514.1 Protein of unknown function [Salipaludibacillus aurantiacus]